MFPAPFTEDLRIDPLLGNALAFQAGGLIILLVVAACSVSTGQPACSAAVMMAIRHGLSALAVPCAEIRVGKGSGSDASVHVCVLFDAVSAHRVRCDRVTVHSIRPLRLIGNPTTSLFS